MHIQENTAVVNRLRRVTGQLKRVEEQIASGGSCADVIPQLLAVKGSVDAATVAYVKQAISECRETATAEEMAALLETLVKKL